MGDNLLTELNCSICKSLLSTPPILLDHDGHNICGRCEIDTNLKYIHNVCYEILASQFEFPCQFIKEGCTVKKNFGKIKLHEEKCLYRIVKCDIGKCEWYGRLNGFILHCSNSHQDSVMKINDLRKLEGGEGCCILDVIGHYFLIKWKLDELKLELQLQDILYTEMNFVFDINLFKSNNTKVPIKTLDNIKTNTKDVSFDFQETYEGLLISFTINSSLFITANNISINSDYLQKIICLYCNHQMVSPIWKCHLGHITCVDCTEYDYDVCKGCDDNGVTFTRVPELEVLTLISTYTCKSCAESFNVTDIQEHEQNCIKRIYECPYCTSWRGFINEIIPHDKWCTKTYSHDAIMATEVTIGGNDNTSEFRLIAYNNLFSIMFEELSLGINVMINNHGPSSLLGWYDYEAEIYHAEDPYFPFNKTYKNAHRCYNQHLIEIRNSDIDKFGETRPFKITVKIHLLHGIARNMNVGKTLKLTNMNQ